MVSEQDIKTLKELQALRWQCEALRQELEKQARTIAALKEECQRLRDLAFSVARVE